VRFGDSESIFEKFWGYWVQGNVSWGWLVRLVDWRGVVGVVSYILLHGVPYICPVCVFIYHVGGGTYLVVPSSDCFCCGFPWSKRMIELVGESGFSA